MAAFAKEARSDCSAEVFDRPVLSVRFGELRFSGLFKQPLLVPQ
jgi:hypothetical protein